MIFASRHQNCSLFLKHTLLTALLLQSVSCEKRVEYDFATLDVPPGSFGTRVLGVNANGDMVGISEKGSFLYRDGKSSAISVEGLSFAEVAAINATGIIVGSYRDSVTKQYHAFIYDRKTYTNIEPPAVTYTDPSRGFSYAYGINDHGHVVGYYVDDSGGHGFHYDGNRHDKLDYPGPGAPDTRATGINTKGQIVGFYLARDEKRFHGFIYDSGKFRTLDYPGQDVSHTRLQGINDRGDIVGFCSCGPTKAARGFLYRDGAFTDIRVPNSGETFPNGINNNGLVVGFYNASDGGHGFYAMQSERKR